METHAVPQEIMSVEFKLFGNFLSLREFIFISIGLAIAYFFYFLLQNGVLPGILAVPAILFFGVGGTMIGLLPIQERPLDQWIINYFTAIRKPTQRVWKKFGFSSLDAAAGTHILTKDHIITPPSQSQTKIFTGGAAKKTTQADPADIVAEKTESAELDRIAQAIDGIENGQAATNSTAATSAASATSTATPSTSPAASDPASPAASDPASPATSDPASPAASAPTISPSAPPATSAAPPAATPSPSQKPQITPASPLSATQGTIILNSSKTPMQMPPDPSAPSTAQPQTSPQPKPAEPQMPSSPHTGLQPPSFPGNKILTIDDTDVERYATTITSLESKTNTINIVVKDQNGQILPGVVCVIKNTHGDPVRAAISNILGQILNNIPLNVGMYKISLTKQGHVFPEVIRNIKGGTYPPIEIKAL